MKSPDSSSPILVTGGAGYIGGCLVEQLLVAGYRVRVLDSLLYGAAGLGSARDHPRFDLVEGDIRDAEIVRRALEGISTVVHLAAIVGDPACALLPEVARAVNQTATGQLVELAIDAGVDRLIFASTCSVYGASGTDITEESSLAPVSLYAETKIAAESIVLMANSPGIATTVLRFATLYGIAPRLRFDLVANVLTARAVRGLPIAVHGGHKWRPFLHVADAARAIVQVLAADQPLNGIFNVGLSSENYQLASLGRLVLDLVPGTTLSIDDAKEDERSYHVRFDRFAATGFRPQRTLRDGLSELRDTLTADTTIAIDDPAWSNIAWLQREIGRQTDPVHP